MTQPPSGAIERRALITATAAIALATTLPAPSLAATPPRFFSQPELTLVRAITARFIPADEYSPGADEAGVPDFIDFQVAGPFGTGARTYMQGPFPTGATAEQGFQEEWTPRQLYRDGLAQFDAVVRAREGKPFAELPPDTQDSLLKALEDGQLDLSPVPGRAFFGLILGNTTEGFFADPIHGGNKDMVGWKLIGFPGAHAAYLNDVENHGAAYVRAPVSLADYHAMDMQ